MWSVVEKQKMYVIMLMLMAMDIYSKKEINCNYCTGQLGMHEGHIQQEQVLKNVQIMQIIFTFLYIPCVNTAFHYQIVTIYYRYNVTPSKLYNLLVI